MTKINKFATYLYLITGFFIVIYIIYIRFFLVRMPKDLYIDFSSETYKIKIIFLILSIIICFFIIINNIIIEFNLNKKNNRFDIISGFITKIIDNSLKQLYTVFISFFDDAYNITSKISTKFYNYCHIYPETLLLFITYIIRLIIVVIFLTEIIFVFKLNYFYKSFGLLCIILFIKIFIYVLRDFASNIEALEEALIIKDCGIDEETQLPITKYTLKPEYSDNNLDYLIKEFILCNKLSGYLEMYDRYSKFFNSKFNILLYTLYLCGWLYILFCNLYLV